MDSIKDGKGKDGYIEARSRLMTKCHTCMVDAGGVSSDLIPPLPEVGVELPGTFKAHMLSAEQEKMLATKLRRDTAKQGAGGVASDDRLKYLQPAMLFIVLVGCGLAFGSDMLCGTDVTSSESYDLIGTEKRNRSMMGDDSLVDDRPPHTSRFKVARGAQVAPAAR